MCGDLGLWRWKGEKDLKEDFVHDPTASELFGEENVHSIIHIILSRIMTSQRCPCFDP